MKSVFRREVLVVHPAHGVIAQLRGLPNLRGTLGPGLACKFARVVAHCGGHDQTLNLGDDPEEVGPGSGLYETLTIEKGELLVVVGVLALILGHRRQQQSFARLLRVSKSNSLGYGEGKYMLRRPYCATLTRRTMFSRA